MPHFRFHVINDIDAPDDEGQELANLGAHINVSLGADFGVTRAPGVALPV